MATCAPKIGRRSTKGLHATGKRQIRTGAKKPAQPGDKTAQLQSLQHAVNSAETVQRVAALQRIANLGADTASAARRVIQRATLVEYQNDPINVGGHEVLDEVAHDRVMHSNADRLNAAHNCGYPAIPAGQTCNHHEGYSQVKGRIQGQIEGLDAETAVDWLNNRGAHVDEVALGTFRRFDIAQAIRNDIAGTANHPDNLFYWPTSSGGNPDRPTGAAPGAVTRVNLQNRLDNYRNALP